MLEGRGIKKNFGSYPALKDVTFHADPGQVTGIIGPNGAGKTTLLRILSTLLAPSDGKVFYDGKEIVDKKKMRRLIGFVSHQPLLYLDLTPLENLRLFASLSGTNATLDEIEEKLRMLNLLPFAKAPVRSLSKGMIQKLAFTKAVLHDPHFVLLDEPFAGLDLTSVEAVKASISKLKEKNRTILVVMHDLNLCFDLSDKILILSDGRISDSLDTSRVSFEQMSRLYYERIAVH
jgi:ABC-type multidrug transport system ATPase subunit